MHTINNGIIIDIRSSYKYNLGNIPNSINISEYDLYLALNSLNDISSIFESVYNDMGDTIYLLDQLKDENKEFHIGDIVKVYVMGVDSNNNYILSRENAIKEERYEDAAKIRDELKKYE